MRGSDLTPWVLRYAYENGAFPMAADPDEINGRIGWYRPPHRCLMPIEGIHVSRSLAKTIRRADFDVRFDHDFEGTMRDCIRGDESGDWISEDIIRAFLECHHGGWGHSCEIWREGRRVGGTYGLAIGAAFCAESMFHRETDMSKVALWALGNELRAQGFTLLDAQYLTPHLESLGGYEVSDRTYQALLLPARRKRTRWDAWTGDSPSDMATSPSRR